MISNLLISRKKFANILILSIIYVYIPSWEGFAKIYPSRGTAMVRQLQNTGPSWSHGSKTRHRGRHRINTFWHYWNTIWHCSHVSSSSFTAGNQPVNSSKQCKNSVKTVLSSTDTVKKITCYHGGVFWSRGTVSPVFWSYGPSRSRVFIPRDGYIFANPSHACI